MILLKTLIRVLELATVRQGRTGAGRVGPVPRTGTSSSVRD